MSKITADEILAKNIKNNLPIRYSVKFYKTCLESMQEHTKQHIEALREVLKENVLAFDGLNPDYPKKSEEKYIPMVAKGTIDTVINQFLENIK